MSKESKMKEKKTRWTSKSKGGKRAEITAATKLDMLPKSHADSFLAYSLLKLQKLSCFALDAHGTRQQTIHICLTSTILCDSATKVDCHKRD